MKTVISIYLCLFLAGGGLAHAQTQCDRTQVKETGVTDAVLILVTTVMTNPLTADCKALTSVLNEVISRGETGGKNSKKNELFNPMKGEADLKKAIANPDTRGRIEKIRADVVDEGARAVYEAAILEEEGYRDARELKLRQLQQRLY
jgi:hypothetical protein